MFSETARIALHGEYPFYLPSFATGFPLYQSPHYSPAYPFYFFGLLDYGGPLQSLHTLTQLAIFHRIIWALNFFVLLRCVRLRPWAAFLGAAVGVLAYNSELYSGWITIVSGYTWHPLLVAGGVLLLQKPSSLPGILLLGIAGGLVALASASQALAHALFLSAILFSAGAVWLYLKEGFRSVARLIMSLAVAGAIAFGLGAVSAVPVYLGINEMIRHLGGGFVLGHEKIPWAKFTELQMAPKDFAAILFKPGAVEIVGSPYVGPLGVAGVIFALTFASRLHSFQKFLLLIMTAVGLYGLLSAFGTHFGFAYVNYHLPLLDKIREPGRNLALFVMGVVVLSGIGFDQVGCYLARKKTDQNYGRVQGIIAAMIGLCFIGVTAWEMFRRGWSRQEQAVLLLAPAVFLLVLLIHASSWRLSLLAALSVSVAAAIAPVRTFPAERGDYSKSTNRRNLAILSELRSKVPPDNYRIDFVDSETSPYTWGMNASYFGFHSFYNRLTPQPYDQFRLSGEGKTASLREMMGGRYVLCAPTEKPTDPAAVSRFELQGFTLFENPAHMERLALVHSLAGTISDEHDFVARASRGLDFGHSLYVQRSDAESVRDVLESKAETANIVDDRQEVVSNLVNRVSARFTSSHPGVVVLNEWFTSAWHARVNGKSEATLRVNQWQVGVPVHAGQNTVEFRYRPSLSWFLLILSRITWLALGVFIAIRLFRRRWGKAMVATE